MRSESWVGKLATPVIDLLAILAYPLLLRIFVNLFNRQDVWNILIILGAYTFMCGAILVSKRLEQNPELDTKRADKEGEESVKSADGLPGWVKALSWPFAIFVFVMILMTSGILESGNESGARLERFIIGETWGTIPALVIFISTFLLFPLVLLKKPRPKIRYGSGAHLLLRTLSVFAVNGMVLVTAAFWEWQLAGTEPMDLSFAAKILVFILAYAVFLMFYAPPRLALLSLEPSRWAYAGYVLFLGYTLWKYMT